MRSIFDHVVSAGRSVRGISRRLYEDGVASPSGREVWATSTLSGLIRNRSYTGSAEWFRHETIGPPPPGQSHGRRQLRPREDWIRVPVPAIITEETFEAAQRVKRDNSIFSPRRTTPGLWLLRGLVVCGRCGVKSYTQQMSSSADGGTRRNRYYSCPYHDAVKAGGPDKRCTERRVRADELDAFVFDQVREILLRPDVLLAGEQALVSREPAPDDEILDAQLDRLTRRVEEATAERRRITDLYQAGHIDMKELDRRATEADSRRHQLEIQQNELTAQRPPARGRQPAAPTGQQLRQPSRRRDRHARLRPTTTTAAPDRRGDPRARLADRAAPTDPARRPTRGRPPPKNT